MQTQLPVPQGGFRLPKARAVFPELWAAMSALAARLDTLCQELRSQPGLYSLWDWFYLSPSTLAPRLALPPAAESRASRKVEQNWPEGAMPLWGAGSVGWGVCLDVGLASSGGPGWSLLLELRTDNWGHSPAFPAQMRAQEVTAAAASPVWGALWEWGH